MKRRKSRKSIQAAGGIVIRHAGEPLIAIVQLRKSDEWVLPKGKLDRGETALAAARREVLEEVGHEVDVHEFVGTMAYDVGTRPKVVQFWRMQALGEPADAVVRTREQDWLGSDPLGSFDDALARVTESFSVPGILAAAVRHPKLGAMTAERWWSFYKDMVEVGALPDGLAIDRLFTLQFVNKRVGML